VHHTGRFISTTDTDLNHFASFYPGAMTEDADIDLGELAGSVDLVLIGASDPDAMRNFTRQCRKHGIPFAADTSWQLARMEGEQVRDLVDGAAYLFCNEYECTLTERKSGWTPDEVTAHVGVKVTTLGAAGARVDRVGEEPILVPPITGVQPVEPTGAGDAFRSGFLAATHWGLSLERAAQLGNLMAVQALEAVGPQDYELEPEPLAKRFAAVYGAEAAGEIAEHYSV
jgi:adenosine kinase